MKIAMWSGPRNLSTALMYSFGNRSDCAVIDEPFYAVYLAMSGLDHPMRGDILASQSQDSSAVADELVAANPDGKAIFYQKHMTQHMIPGVPRGWMKKVRNVFLIRHPARVIASYAAKRENPTLDDTGFRQQAELYDEVLGWGGDPVVIDSHDIRADPETAVQTLCDAIDVVFSPRMLCWPRGGHLNDGVWAAHWYEAVRNSTGFAGAEGQLPQVNSHFQGILNEALPYYEKLQKVKLQC